MKHKMNFSHLNLNETADLMRTLFEEDILLQPSTTEFIHRYSTPSATSLEELLTQSYLEAKHQKGIPSTFETLEDFIDTL